MSTNLTILQRCQEGKEIYLVCYRVLQPMTSRFHVIGKEYTRENKLILCIIKNMAGSEEKWRIRVVASRNFGFYIGLGKNLLREHGHIELSGLGNAITNTIRAAERLVSFGYADLTSF